VEDESEFEFCDEDEEGELEELEVEEDEIDEESELDVWLDEAVLLADEPEALEADDRLHLERLAALFKFDDVEFDSDEFVTLDVAVELEAPFLNIFTTEDELAWLWLLVLPWPSL